MWVRCKQVCMHTYMGWIIFSYFEMVCRRTILCNCLKHFYLTEIHSTCFTFPPDARYFYTISVVIARSLACVINKCLSVISCVWFTSERLCWFFGFFQYFFFVYCNCCTAENSCVFFNLFVFFLWLFSSRKWMFESRVRFMCKRYNKNIEVIRIKQICYRNENESRNGECIW